MIRWGEVGPLLKEVFTEIAPDPSRDAASFGAEWTEGKRGLVNTRQKFALLLKLTTVVGIGRDETRREYVDPSSTDPADSKYLGMMRVVRCGQRKFTIQCQVHSIDRSDDLVAHVMLDRIRIGLWSDDILDKLLACEVAPISCGQSIKANYKDDGRVISCAIMDVMFGAAFTCVDDVPRSWIERIEYSSHIADVDGVELPSPPNVQNLLTPP